MSTSVAGKQSVPVDRGRAGKTEVLKVHQQTLQKKISQSKVHESEMDVTCMSVS